MRVLHLFSNCKWTGPAEPALNLCVSLRKLGVEADFACAPDAGRSINKVVETARDLGLEPVLDLHLKKHRNPWHNWLDTRTLRKILRAKKYDLVHCHMDNDHAIAVQAAAPMGIPIVRSSYEGHGLKPGNRHRKLLAHTRLVLEPAQMALDHDCRELGLNPAHAHVVPGAVDTERFNPARELPDGRRWRNIPADAFVLGIVARMQRHRHYEDLFEALKRLVNEFPDTHLIVVGRGTHQDKVGFEPVQRLGLHDRVHFTGFIDGENYVGMLKAFDAGIYLVPGSDGTCRATREIMAMGKPVAVAQRGMLPEIVTHEHDGLVFDGSAEGLYAALRRLASSRAYSRDLGRAAKTTAHTRYALPVQAAQVLGLYSRALGVE
ncbi:MAG: glycosyltransferase family 4 protein [Candidatus Hydrogenedentes bacterium]|nr:glycosyltransferase family 4 protein [Candidatus Hydrogenedentota bacterium]